MKELEMETKDRFAIGCVTVTYSRGMRHGLSLRVKENNALGMLSFDYKTPLKLRRELVTIQKKAVFLEETLDF